MKKIRGFKLSVRPKEVHRLARKAGLDLVPFGVEPPPARGGRPAPPGTAVPFRQPPPEGRPNAVSSASVAALSREIDPAVRLMTPAVLYESFPGATVSDSSSKLLAPIPGVAFSLVLASLGESIGAKKAELEGSDPLRARLWAVICESALAEAVRFASSLIETEAALENCELSPLNPLSGNEALAAALDRLDCSKIGVSLGDDGLQPRDSTIVTLSWLSKSRGRRPKA